jgi:hypothetical protein
VAKRGSESGGVQGSESRGVLHQGPIPYFLHGLLEYLAAALLIASSFLFNFHSDAAQAVSIVGGVIVLVVTAITVSPTGIVKSLPLPAHIVVDFAVTALLIAAPFLFGFSKKTTPTAFFIVLGVVYLLLIIATRFPRRETLAPQSE